ncbi:hypothetical protein QQS21_004595 [Conoideocrella luteorostrata]|uniref:Uncharacterized protein n=1 Tax=Conoideocrella luteorostrata TaxID=1105319 RepID=A0AAJ0CR69_9HYPO|nr:hypothetical protein QQS21_004595 [Conoideocrella luteorostrata]
MVTPPSNTITLVSEPAFVTVDSKYRGESALNMGCVADVVRPVKRNSERHLGWAGWCAGYKERNSAETLLHVELVKAEDMLRAYRNSLQNGRAMEISSPKVHRFFHSRLVGDARHLDFYGTAIHLTGELIPLDKILSMPWIINGESYPSLRQSFDVAPNIMSPSSLQITSPLLAFGMGDAHGGNVMIEPKSQHQGNRTLLYVDYEVAGFHPIMLDLAKPFYNDVFF